MMRAGLLYLKVLLFSSGILPFLGILVPFLLVVDGRTTRNEVRRAWSIQSVNTTSELVIPKGEQVQNVKVGSDIYLIGGCSSDNCVLNLWKLNRDSGPSKYETISPKGDIPHGRNGFSVTAIGDQIFMFGGGTRVTIKTKIKDTTKEHKDEKYLTLQNDVYRYSTETNTWQRMKIDQNSPIVDVPKLMNHAATTNGNGKIYIFGGVTERKKISDAIFILDVFGAKVMGNDLHDHLVRWEKPVAMGRETPEGREFHTLTFIGNNRLALVGGATRETIRGTTHTRILSDLFIYDIIDDRWQKVVLLENGDLKRYKHTAIRHGTELIVVGGRDGRGAAQINRTIPIDYADYASFCPLFYSASVPASSPASVPASIPASISVSESQSFSTQFSTKNADEARQFSNLYSIDTRSFNKWKLIHTVSDDMIHTVSEDTENTNTKMNSTTALTATPPTCDHTSQVLTAEISKGKLFLVLGSNLNGKVNLFTVDTWADKETTCPVGFTGDDCLEKAICPMDCNGNGRCGTQTKEFDQMGKNIVSNDNQFLKCSCLNGFFGQACQFEAKCPFSKKMFKNQMSSKCSNNGTCERDGTCKCYRGYKGKDCSKGRRVCLNDCSGNGECLPDSTCKCRTGFTGADCGKQTDCLLSCCGNGKCIPIQKSENANAVTTNFTTLLVAQQQKGETLKPLSVAVKQCSCSPGYHGKACNLKEDLYKILVQTSTEKLRAEGAGYVEKVRKAQILAQKLQEKDQDADFLLKDIHELVKKASSVESRIKQLEESDSFLGVSVVEKCEMDFQDALVGASESQKSAKLNSAFNNTTTVGKSAFNNSTTSFKAVTTVSSSMAIKARTKKSLVLNTKPPTLKNFGIDELNSAGKSGIIESECKRNCNYRGICDAGTCYCETGFYGDACQIESVSKKGNFPLDTVIIVAASVCLLVTFSTFFLLQFQEYQKSNTERAMGYSV